MISTSDKRTKRRLERMGYAFKHSEVGYWVDGAYGYLVAGYYRTQTEAISCAANAIQQASGLDSRPVHEDAAGYLTRVDGMGWRVFGVEQ